MADLKAGTTIGNTLVWTQGNFPLTPSGNTLLYKSFILYSENNKPQAVDNDFVSKADGGTYNNQVVFRNGLTIENTALGNLRGAFLPGNGDNATQAVCNVDIKSHWGLGISSYQAGPRVIWIDTRSGEITTISTINSNISTAVQQPTAINHLTRKDYVDNLINNTTSNVNTRVLRSGDTMTGILTAPNFVTINLATSNNQVPQLGQVVQRGIVVDYGTF